MELKIKAEDVTQALELCTTDNPPEHICKDCAFVMLDECCTPLLKASLNLIKELQAENENMRNEALFIEREEAESIIDFLEAEFIQGIGNDKDLKDNEYVKSIRAVYEKLKEMTE